MENATISTINVGERYRKEIGDIDGLAASIAALGVLQPIGIDSNYNLIFGERRLRACQKLGLEKIPARVIHVDNLAAEHDENEMRKEFTISERVAIGRAREEHFSKEARERQVRKPADSVVPNSAQQNDGAKTRDLAAAEAGFKRTSYSDASKVVDSGDEEVIEIMDSGQASVSFAASLVDEDEDTKTKVVEKIKAGVKPVQARREVKKESLPEVVIPDGKYRVIYSDPPWKYGDTRDGLTGYSAAADHYPDMSIKELCELDIKSIAADDAVLFMWVTSPLLYEAAPIIGAWGFKYKAAYVWDKVKHNVGHYVSVRHEILLICTRGSCTPDDKTLHDSVVSIERTGHSRKPEYFRELIDKMYTHGPKLEMFRRGDAPEGWEVWGNQADD